MHWLRRNWFNVALGALFLVALRHPELGAAASPLHPETLRTVCIALIFFLTGLMLRSSELRTGLTSYRLHAFSQLFNFAFVPAVALAIRAASPPAVPPEILDGLIALAILPTTITSCVVFTSLARGNVAGAVFNAVVGNLAGLAVSPLLFSLLIAESVGVRVDWSQLWKIAELIVLPLVMGIALRPGVRRPVNAVAGYLPLVSGAALLTIVFFALTSAFAAESPLWRWSKAELLAPVGLVVGFHGFLLAAAWFGAAAVGLSESDRRAALFVAPQKTVAMGLPLLHFFFAGRPALAGLMSIPLIFYHPLQLLVAGPLALRLAGRARRADVAPETGR